MRLFQLGFVLLLCFLLAVTVGAEGCPEITGPEALYPRDSFEIELRIDRGDVNKITFELDCDPAHLQLLAMWAEDETQWKSEANMQGHTFVRVSPGTDDSQVVFRAKLRLKTVDAGTQIRIVLKNVVLWMEDSSEPVSDIVWERTVSQIVSDDNALVSLQLSDCVLSPGFSPEQLHYTATVSHHVAQVFVNATTRDDGASIQVDSPALEYGKTSDVTVTVTAEDGSVRVYTVAVTREDAPDRIPSNNCDLQKLEITDYKLSPEFAPGVTDYVLWLPYETTKVEISAEPADSKATVTIVDNKGFKAGEDNPIYVTCTAEDGTQKIYIITAKRAEPYVPEPSETMTVDTVAATVGTVYTAAPDVPVWVYVVVAVAAVTGCAAVGILITDRKK